MRDTHEHKVCEPHELQEGRMKAVRVSGVAVLLARVAGEVLAVENRCPHEEIALYKGCLRGDQVECSLHGARFSLRTGEVLRGPALQGIAVYAVREDDNGVYVAV